MVGLDLLVERHVRLNPGVACEALFVAEFARVRVKIDEIYMLYLRGYCSCGKAGQRDRCQSGEQDQPRQGSEKTVCGHFILLYWILRLQRFQISHFFC